jgi:MFS family permease
MPRALFPALAASVFGGGATTLGFLYAAPGAGALVGALTTGWVSRIQRQGLAVIIAVIAWGAAITCFGLVSWLPLALLLLALAGCADVISAVFRSTIIQLAVPDALRGRLAGLQIAVVTGGPRVGDLEAGAVAAGFGNTVSVVSGGLACIAGALLLARALPGFRRQRMDPVHHDAAAPGGLGVTARDEKSPGPVRTRALLVVGRLLGVEVAGIEPASFSTSPGLLRAQLALLFSAPAIMQARRRQAQPLFGVPPSPAAGSGGGSF